MDNQAEVKAETKAAALRALESQFNFYSTRIRLLQKQRFHRNPPDHKITLALHNWIAAGGGEILSSEMLTFMRDHESRLNKPCRDWTPLERKEAYELATRYFQRLTTQYCRSRGRPKKLQGGLGLSRYISIQNLKRITRKTNKQLLNRILNYERNEKLRNYAKKEEEQLKKEGRSYKGRFSTLGKIIEYLGDDVEEVLNQRLSPGKLQRILTRLGIDPTRKKAIKMSISRARRKRRPL